MADLRPADRRVGQTMRPMSDNDSGGKKPSDQTHRPRADGGLDLASDRVDGVLAAFELPAETEARARELAAKADLHWPINRSPSGIAAAAVYVATLEHGDEVRQAPIATAAGCTEVTLRDTYHEIYRALGYPDPTDRYRDSEDAAEAPERWPNPAQLEEFSSRGAVDD